MSDIVQRLRHLAKLLGFDLTATLNEAADEIERLREAIKGAAVVTNTASSLLREARQYVSDAGADEDSETNRMSGKLLDEIDAALTSHEGKSP